jgi:carbonic anhydrase
MAPRGRRAGGTALSRKGWNLFDIIVRYDPSRPRDRQHPEDAGEGCRRLEEGNQLFASLATDGVDGCRIIPIDLEDMGIGTPGDVLKQQPFAVVVGCADARVPTELIFESSCNELTSLFTCSQPASATRARE